MRSMKKIAVLGSTGSVGKTTLSVAQHLNIEIEALTAGSNMVLLMEQIEQVRPKVVAILDRSKAAVVRAKYPHIRVLEGEEGLCEVAALPEIDGVMMAIMGMAALSPTLAAIRAKKPIAFASKEVLVSAGELVMNLARQMDVPLIPVDSEHSAIFQCLEGRDRREIKKIIITSSGGPFLHKNLESLETISVEEALCHPTWRMGPKITIDSSTLMNKALEMIEAFHLFQMPIDQIEVLIHPQSIVHCLIEWLDGNLFAHLHPPNMSYPIQYALTYPQRSPGPGFDFCKYGHLDFFLPDHKKFPAIGLAQEVLRKGKSMPCYLNAANEVLVARFLQKNIQWKEIMRKLETLLARHQPLEIHSLEEVIAVDKQARQEASLV